MQKGNYLSGYPQGEIFWIDNRLIFTLRLGERRTKRRRRGAIVVGEPVARSGRCRNVGIVALHAWLGKINILRNQKN